MVDHAMGSQVNGGGVIGASISPESDWTAIQAGMSAAFQDPSNLEGMAEQWGMPKQAVAGIVTGDLLVHSWDLARSIGADESLPEEAVVATLTGIQRMPAEFLRSPNMFGSAIDVGDDATNQEKLLGFLGRQV